MTQLKGLPDCGDRSCFFNRYRASSASKTATNGGCRCGVTDLKRGVHLIVSQFNATEDRLIDALSQLLSRCEDECRVAGVDPNDDIQLLKYNALLQDLNT